MQIHGGDIYRNDVELDFSTNLNPFGMPESVERAAIEGIRRSYHYPDTECSELRAAIAKKEGVKPDWIVCGNGAAEVIFQLILAMKPKKALLACPTFVEYEQALKAADCQIEKLFLEKSQQFQVTETILEYLTPELDILFLCNPNNPTGAVVEPELLTRILNTCKEHNILLVIDECFQDFLMEEAQDTRKDSVRDYPRVVLLKAFTKMYGMAGLRLGYAITANSEIHQRMKQVTQPWNVSIPAQYAGIAACAEEEYASKTRAYVAAQRDYLKQELRNLGMQVYDSKANFIFFEGPVGLYDMCLQHRVLIRSCKNYEGLGESFYRIAVKSQKENEALIQILQKIVRDTNG